MDFPIRPIAAVIREAGNVKDTLEYRWMAATGDVESREVVQAGLRGWDWAQVGDVAPLSSGGGTWRLDKDRVPLIEQVHSERQTHETTANHQFEHGRTVAASGTEGKRVARIARKDRRPLSHDCHKAAIISSHARHILLWSENSYEQTGTKVDPLGGTSVNTPSHFEESLQRDIDAIRAKVAEMAGLSGRALEASLQALVQRSRQLAYGVILRDQHIDERETELNRLCLEFLVRHQPVAGHLRFIFTAIQINKELERIGDYAESVARQVLSVSGLEPQPPHAIFVELGELSIRMLREAVQAFLEKDADLAQRTMVLEEQANVLRNSINAELMELSRRNQLSAAALTPLLTIARRYERVSDQAKNLCEEVLYMCTGEFAKHKGGDTFRILFFDLRNACLSQIAEGLGNAMHVPRFQFSSAGAAPEPLDARAVEFLADKGLDISAQASKALEQVPQWDQFQLVVALGALARKALPTRPGKTIYFTWPIKDPAEVEGSPDQVKAAFESAYRSLEAHIKELLGAIVEEPQTSTKP